MYKWNQHSDILALKNRNTMDMWCRSEDTYEMIMYIFTAEGLIRTEVRKTAMTAAKNTTGLTENKNLHLKAWIGSINIF